MPTQLQKAKRIFIANGGVDAIASYLLDGDDDRPYNLVFNSVKSSGRYDLVLTPAEADLVWNVQFAVSATASGLPHMGTSPDYFPQLRLAIMDPKTNILLWTVTTKVEKAFRQKTLVKNIETAVDTLMNKLPTLSAPPSSTP